jgi:hypothetical protein
MLRHFRSLNTKSGTLAPLLLAAMLWPVPVKCCISDSADTSFSAMDCCFQGVESCHWTVAVSMERTGASSTAARLTDASAAEIGTPCDRLAAHRAAIPPALPPLFLAPTRSVLRI